MSLVGGPTDALNMLILRTLLIRLCHSTINFAVLRRERFCMAQDERSGYSLGGLCPKRALCSGLTVSLPIQALRYLVQAQEQPRGSAQQAPLGPLYWERTGYAPYSRLKPAIDFRRQNAPCQTSLY
jgi:hypothetical protein